MLDVQWSSPNNRSVFIFMCFLFSFFCCKIIKVAVSTDISCYQFLLGNQGGAATTHNTGLSKLIFIRSELLFAVSMRM